MAGAPTRRVRPFLPVAVRAYTGERKGRQPAGLWPRRVLVIDAETTIDETQRLTFGSYRYLREGSGGALACVEEGLFYAPDLRAGDLATLRAYAASHLADVIGSVERRLHLWSLREFVERVLWRASYQHPTRPEHDPELAPAAVVGFNLPFDLSRLASSVSEARGPKRKGQRRIGGFVGGFGFDLFTYSALDGEARNAYRPGVLIKTIDSKRHLIGYRPPRQIDEPEHFDAGFRGHFLDLRTLVFALTDRSYSLASACEAFGVRHGKSEAEQHGAIDDAYIDYNRRDVQATAELYERLIAQYREHPIVLQPSKAFSPASIGKSYLRVMGIRSPLERQPDFPKRVLGHAMSAYYGGRAECRIRRVPVPVVYVDFLSMYPTVCALMDLWSLVTCNSIEVIDATDQVRRMLASLTVKQCFDPDRWRTFVGLVLIEPDGDVLPVRSRYAHSPNPSWQIGVNPLTSKQALWFTIPDAIAASQLTGRPPRILKAIRFLPQGQAAGLCSTRLGGLVEIDPSRRDFFRAVIEQRKTLPQTNLPAPDAELLDRFLKVIANAASYGIYAEMVRQELGSRTSVPVTVHGLDDQPFQAEVSAPEEPGEFCFPPVAACITGAARLMLALTEHLVSEAGGSYAICDTDSMAIVATEQGGSIPCPGGRHATPDGQPAVHALSWEQVEAIRARFAALNPYDSDAVSGPILELEDENYADRSRSQRRQLYCLATSAKRYALYTLNDRGGPELVKWSEHGLGHLLNPTDPDSPDRDWIRQLWEREVRQTHGLADGEPDWLDRPALGRVTVSKPHALRAFRYYNAGKPYSKQIKPFNFMLTAYAPVMSHPQDADPERFQLIAPWSHDPRAWKQIEWINRDDPDQRYRVTTDLNEIGPGVARIKTYRDVLADYRVHPEPKSLAPDYARSGWHTRGLLLRRPVIATRIVYVGKESNELDDARAGLAHDETGRLTEYTNPRKDEWTELVVPTLREIGVGALATESGVERTLLWRYLRGRTTPRDGRRRQLTSIAAAHAAERIKTKGQVPPRDSLDCIAAYAHLAP
jgi:hypothetical protein